MAVTSTSQLMVQPISTRASVFTTSMLDKEGPPLTASDLERALERLEKEMDDA
jgi:hypothetical protein